MTKELTAEIWICDSCDKEYGFANEVNTPTKCTCGNTTFVPHTVKKELTAEEYLDQYTIPDPEGDLFIDISNVYEYKKLLEKEAVEKFARELIEVFRFDSSTVNMHIRNLAKQHGVNI